MKGMRMNRARMVIALLMLIVLAVTLAGAFLTRGVMAYLPFLQARKGNWTGSYVPHGVVDQRPWQTAATLAALAQAAEERELAREAERLADHEVDQAFSQSLRQASLAKPNLSGKALALQQRVTELQDTIKNDQARIASLSAGAGTRPADAVANGSDLESAFHCHALPWIAQTGGGGGNERQRNANARSAIAPSRRLSSL